jgi:hypothetical protein
VRFARAGGLAPGELLLGLGVGAQLARDLISLGPQIAALARVLGDVVELLRLRAARIIERPEKCAKLLADPTLATSAAEEFLRWTTPVSHFLRTANQPLTLGGTAISEGDTLCLYYPRRTETKTSSVNPSSFASIERRIPT